MTPKTNIKISISIFTSHKLWELTKKTSNKNLKKYDNKTSSQIYLLHLALPFSTSLI